MLFLGTATIPETYWYTVGLHVPFWALEESRDADGPERCTILGYRRKAAKDCFSCGMPRLFATHEGELCPTCSQVSVGSKASAAASASQALGLAVGVTWLLPVLTSTLHITLHPLPAPPPNPFQPNDHSNVRWDPARVMGTRGRDIGVSQGPEHHGKQGSAWIHHGTEVPVWWLRNGSRRRAGLHRAMRQGTSTEAHAGPPHGADVRLADRDIERSSRQLLIAVACCTSLCLTGCAGGFVPTGCFMVSVYWFAMQSGSPPRRGFGKGFLTRKSNEKGVCEGVLDQKGFPEMQGFSGASNQKVIREANMRRGS